MLSTHRLILQFPSDSLLEEYLDFLNRNRKSAESWSPKTDDEFFTTEFQQNRFSQIQKRIADGTELRFIVSMHSNPSRIISEITYSNIVRGNFQSCHLGYVSDKEIHSKGYTTEALKATIDYIFSEIKLHRIEANVMPNNAPSIRLLPKLNFEHQGTFKKYLRINDKWQDHLCFVLLNPAS